MSPVAETIASPLQLNPEQAQAIIERCRRDPLFFTREVLGMDVLDEELMPNGITVDQEDTLLAMVDNKRVVVRSGNGLGKTVAGAVAVLWFAFCFRPCCIVTTATVGRQVKAQLWGEIPRLYRNAPFDLGGDIRLTDWRLSADSFATGFSTDKVDRFQGWHSAHLLFVLDEGSGLPEEILDGVEGSMSGEHARLLFLGNPLRPSGAFYRVHRQAGWAKVHYSPSRYPNVLRGAEVIPGGMTREWIEGRRADWGEKDPRYVARVEGEFPQQDMDALIPLEWAEAALARHNKGEGERRLGVDIARFGDDRTVMIWRHGPVVERVAIHRKLDLMQTTGLVVEAIRSGGLDPACVFIDDTGLGGGVTDRLREQGFFIQPVNFGRRATDAADFANVRTELFWHMRNAFNPDHHEKLICIPAEHRELALECAAPLYTYTSSGQLQLEQKDAIKKRLGRSPDLADALALTYSIRALCRIGRL